MVDPTIQAEPGKAEPMGVAPKPTPIAAEPVLTVPTNIDPANALQPPPVETASTAAAEPVVATAPPGWIRDIGNEPAEPVAPPAPPDPSPVTYRNDPTPPAPTDMSPQDMALNAVVNNPRGFIGGIVHEALDQRVNPAFAAMTETAGAVENYLSAQSGVAIKKAQDNIERLYSEVIHQDEAYNSNENVKRDVDRTFHNMLSNGVAGARNGHFDGIMEAGTLTPLQVKAAMSAVKVLHGVTGSPVSPTNVGTAVVETPTSHAPIAATDVMLTPEEENIIAFRERIDPTFRSQFVEAKRTAIERGDFQLD